VKLMSDDKRPELPPEEVMQDIERDIRPYDDSFSKAMATLDAAAAEGKPTPALGVDYAEYKGTYEVDSNREAERPAEDTVYAGWTPQSGITIEEWAAGLDVTDDDSSGRESSG
jgi:hypothetical protein